MQKGLIIHIKNIQMKKIIILFSAALFLLVSCEKTFLELNDLDSLTETVYFDTPQDFEDAANNFYRGLHSHGSV